MVESSLSMKVWFIDRERNRLKSAINLPLKAKREDYLVEGSGGGRKPFPGSQVFFLIILSPTSIHPSEK